MIFNHQDAKYAKSQNGLLNGSPNDPLSLFVHIHFRTKQINFPPYFVDNDCFGIEIEIVGVARLGLISRLIAGICRARDESALVLMSCFVNMLLEKLMAPAANLVPKCHEH